MAFGDKAREHIQRKMLGMNALLQEIAEDLAKEAQDRASWIDRTGEARRGIRSGVESSGDGSRHVLYLAHTTWYARFLEVGAKPHQIKAKLRKALAGPGLEHPAKTVQHPGIKSYGVLAATMDANVNEIGRKVVDYWSR